MQKQCRHLTTAFGLLSGSAGTVLRREAESRKLPFCSTTSTFNIRFPASLASFMLPQIWVKANIKQGIWKQETR